MGQSKYNFLLPPELLASDPATPRDASRLFVYDTASDTIQFDHFFHIDKYLPRDSTLVLNKTRVIPSRITLEKRTGGKIVCLFLLNEKRTTDTQIRAMVDRKISVGDELYATGTSRASKPLMTCMSHEADSTFLFELSISRKDLVALLERQGTMPIPLYLRHTALSDRELHERYQTVYARDDRREQVLDKREHTRQSFSIRVNTSTFALSSRPPADSAGMEGSLDGACTEQGRSARDDMSSTTNLFSVAAPTAGLHFTQRVFRSMQHKNITPVEVLLEVGLGTFAPLTDEALAQGKLHTEWYQLPRSSREAIMQSKSQGRPIIAVGTTVVRTLESFTKLAEKSQESYDDYHPTDIFIREGYKFDLVDHLITNFHLPNSSLIMLVEAFLQHKKARKTVIDLYEIAIQEKFRFYSFGDSMVIL